MYLTYEQKFGILILYSELNKIEDMKCKRKIQDYYLYEGLGVPVELFDVEMCYIDGAWHPKINVREVANKIVAKKIQLGIDDAKHGRVTSKGSFSKYLQK